MSRRLCTCHGKPMFRNGTNASGSQKWLCSETHKGRSTRTMRATRDARAEAGVCHRCNSNPPRAHSPLCRACAIKQAADGRARALARHEDEYSTIRRTL